MRLIIQVMLLVVGMAGAQAQSRIRSADIIDVGVMEIKSSTKTINDSDLSTGTRSEATDVRVVKSGSNIRAQLNTIFGATCKLAGVPNGSKWKLHVIWRYPQPGIKNPDTGKVTLVDEYDDVFTAGPNPLALYWSLSAEYTLVPGLWSLELQQDGRRLLYNEFSVVVAK
jgi:hypothetical protein